MRLGPTLPVLAGLNPPFMCGQEGTSVGCSGAGLGMGDPERSGAFQPLHPHREGPMQKLFIAVSTSALVLACDRQPTAPDQQVPAPNLEIMAASPGGGAIVTNSGEGQPGVFCFFGSFTTTHGTAVRSPQGNATLSCQFDGLPPIPETQRLTGWRCTINIGGISSVTFDSEWVRAPSGEARVICQFSGKPEFNAVVLFGDEVRPGVEAFFTKPLDDFPAGRVMGEVVHVGLACAPLDGAVLGRIALIERGVCAFSQKLTNALNAGATAAMVYNNAAGGDALIEMAGIAPVALPGVFVGRTTGLTLVALGPVTAMLESCRHSATCRGEL